MNQKAITCCCLYGADPDCLGLSTLDVLLYMTAAAHLCASTIGMVTVVINTPKACLSFDVLVLKISIGLLFGKRQIVVGSLLFSRLWFANNNHKSEQIMPYLENSTWIENHA